MAKPTVRGVTEAATALLAEYEAWATDVSDSDLDDAGEPIQAMLAKARTLARKARKLEGDRGRDAEIQVAALVGELEALRDGVLGADPGMEDLPEPSPEAVDAIASGLDIGDADGESLGLQARALYGRFGRHVGERPNTTCDPALVQALSLRLSALLERAMEVVSNDPTADSMEVYVEDLALTLERWVDRHAEIDASYAALTGEARAHAYRALVDLQREAYRVHCERMPVTVVRPKLLKRLIRSVKAARKQLAGLVADGHATDDELAELDALTTYWEGQRKAASSARSMLDPSALAAVVERAAGAAMVRVAQLIPAVAEEDHDIASIAEVADQLADFERQLVRCYRKSPDDENAQVRDDFLGHVRECLEVAERAWATANARATG